ncbi:MAG: hypothetical protein IKC79_03140, partial [Clostridia bacterium]|nr:hypothetical protein [Clostridia bacterium]
VHLSVTQSAYFFDSSAGNIDPVALKSSGTTATNLINNVNSATKSEFPVNAYIDNLDTYMLVLTFGVASSPGTNFSADFSLNLAFMADVQYDTNNEHLLTVSQPINQLDTSWSKVGYNASLNAQATKIETNSLTALKNAYDNRDANGNTGNNHIIDDYVDAVVYKDIDIVNIDIATGEVIGKLSDVNYPFEWYGGAVTLPSGTTLASGRVLTKSETFTVDCYTYYPTMYLRRWMVGNIQYITLSDIYFPGSTKIDAYYTATFESTIFNPDYSVATNSLGNIIPRSYSYWWTPLCQGSTAFLQTYYNFGSLSGSTDSTYQSQFLTWANNLTTDWQNNIVYNPNMSNYIMTNGVQGENWHTFIYNLLYLVKYADNNSQSMVGYGNTYTCSLYYANGVTITTPGGTIITGGSDSNTRYSGERGGGVIGLRGAAGNSAGESVNFNNAGMAYGDQLSTPMYSQEFLTYSNGTNRMLLDGYVGSDKYTSVWCLGLCNAWGNIWTWVFGSAVLYDASTNKSYAYFNFDDYDHSRGNYITSNDTSDWETKNELMLNSKYTRLTYNVPSLSGWYRNMGVSLVDSTNALQSLIGLPTDASSSNAGESIGLSDYYWAAKNENDLMGLMRGANTNDTIQSGIQAFLGSFSILSYQSFLGFRSMLIN